MKPTSLWNRKLYMEKGQHNTNKEFIVTEGLQRNKGEFVQCSFTKQRKRRAVC